MSRKKSPRADCTVIHIPAAERLSRLQGITRAYCRNVGLDEPSVFQAVIAVTELAHRLFTEKDECGSVELSAIRRGDGMALDIRAENDAFRGRLPVRESLEFSRAQRASL
jgi:hypothetical protein